VTEKLVEVGEQCSRCLWWCTRYCPDQRPAPGSQKACGKFSPGIPAMLEQAIPETVDVGGIVAEYLEKNGYDGLYNDDCGCRLEDLGACGDMSSSCIAGWLGPCDCGVHGWHITGDRSKGVPLKTLSVPSGVLVSEYCGKTGIQNCHICEDFDCGDNTSKEAVEKKLLEKRRKDR